MALVRGAQYRQWGQRFNDGVWLKWPGVRRTPRSLAKLGYWKIELTYARVELFSPVTVHGHDFQPFAL